MSRDPRTQYEGHPRKGWSVRELSMKAQVSPRFIIKLTSEPREDYLARADVKRDRVVQLRAQGLTIRAIADETGYSVGTVHRYAKEAR